MHQVREKIKSHIESSLFNMDNIIKTKGINFLLNINDTLSFVLDKLNSPARGNLKYSKIDASKIIQEEINEMFVQHKALNEITINKNINDQNLLINNYITNINQLFINRRRENKNYKR